MIEGTYRFGETEFTVRRDAHPAPGACSVVAIGGREVASYWPDGAVFQRFLGPWAEGSALSHELMFRGPGGCVRLGEAV